MSKRKSAAQKKRQVMPWAKMLIALAVLACVGLVYLDAQVRYSFADKQWQVPARVYARAQQLHQGKWLTQTDLETELVMLGYEKSTNWRQPGRYMASGNQLWISTRGYRSVAGQVKPLRFSVHFSGEKSGSEKSSDEKISGLFDASGASLPGATLEPLEIGSIYPRHREDRSLIRLDQVPRSLVDILLIIEDRNFYQHLGLSPRAIARALVANVQAGRTVQGGSTLTQQLVKNMFLTTDRSFWRKGVEALMALLVELHYSKQEILEAYINEVYLGQEGPRAIHGFDLASRHYFNRPLTELDHGQVALLVGLVKGPSYYDPWRNPERATQRRNIVLQVMLEQQMITPQQHQQFSHAQLQLAKDSAVDGVYPAYLDLVRRQLRRDYDDESLQTEGMKIFTAFDPIVQHHAEKSLANVLKNKQEDLQAAMVVTDVNNGNVIAVVGGRQMRYAGFNRALDAVRPVGSLIKPAVYLAALEQSNKGEQDGSGYTLAKAISDGPVQVQGRDGSMWQPRNFDRESHGQVLLHKALANSYNQATARLGMEVGLDKVLGMVDRLGVKRQLPALPSMLLGAGELSPIEVASMYQTMASHGMYSPLRSIIDIADSNVVAMARYPLNQYQVIDRSLMHLLHYAMLEVVREGTGKNVYQQLPANFRVAGKTGTTNDLRDSWFAGFSGDYLAVVWMGRDDNQSAGLTGSSGALTVWREFIANASHQPLNFNAPPGITYHWIDENTGLLSREMCQGSRYMPFLQGTAPTARSRCQGALPGVWRWFKSIFD